MCRPSCIGLTDGSLLDLTRPSPVPPPRSVIATSTNSKIFLADGTDAAGVAPNAKQRASHDEKREAKRIKLEKREEKEKRRASIAEASKARVESENKGDVVSCGRCGQVFLQEGWFRRHADGWCDSRSERMSKLQGERRVALQLAVRDEVRLVAHSRRISELRVVEVKIKALTQTAERIGIKLEEHKGTLFVVAVEAGSAGEGEG